MKPKEVKELPENSSSTMMMDTYTYIHVIKEKNQEQLKIKDFLND